MVHNNHIKGRANKLYLFNEMRITDYEENGYYSNPEARYITVRAIGGGRFVEVSRSRIARNGNVVTDQLGANPEPHHHSAGATVCRGIQAAECNLCGFRPDDCWEGFQQIRHGEWREHVGMEEGIHGRRSCGVCW